MNSIKMLCITLILPSFLLGMDEPLSTFDSSISQEDEPSQNEISLAQPISRAQSFVLGKPFTAIGDEFMLYPHYLNGAISKVTIKDSQISEESEDHYYIEQRDIALSKLKKLKEASEADYFRMAGIGNTLDLMKQINFEQKLVPQISESDLLHASAYLLGEFENNFTTNPEDFKSDEQIALVYAKNRKKFYDRIKQAANKDQINEAAKAPFGTAGLHDYFAGCIAVFSGMQRLNGDQPLHPLGVCAFWSKAETFSEEESEKFATKVKEMTEKFNKMR